MEITNVKISLASKDDAKLKAFASVTLNDCFVISNIKIIQGKEDKLFIAMPSRKISAEDNSTNYQDICFPINSETRKYFTDEILKAYNSEVQK